MQIASIDGDGNSLSLFDTHEVDQIEWSEDVALDFRLVFLERASARLTLFETCLMELDEAFDGLMSSLPLSFWKPDDLAFNQPKAPPAPRKAPQATIDALVYELRTYGIAGLRNEVCLGRLETLSSDQMQDLIRSLSRLKIAYPAITEELLIKLGECL
jgi:hypothetical protein